MQTWHDEIGCQVQMVISCYQSSINSLKYLCEATQPQQQDVDMIMNCSSQILSTVESVWDSVLLRRHSRKNDDGHGCAWLTESFLQFHNKCYFRPWLIYWLYHNLQCLFTYQVVQDFSYQQRNSCFAHHFQTLDYYIHYICDLVVVICPVWNWHRTAKVSTIYNRTFESSKTWWKARCFACFSRHIVIGWLLRACYWAKAWELLTKMKNTRLIWLASQDPMHTQYVLARYIW